MTETIAFPLWAAAAAAALLAVLAVLALTRIGGRQVLVFVGFAMVLVAAGWLVLERFDVQGKTEQRRAIEARVTALSARALAPNSNLSCLDAAGGSVVHEACEKSLFAGPEQIAAALKYVGARLDLLREIAALGEHDAASFDGLRVPVVRSLEADPFGFVAQVLVARDGCSVSSCYAFGLLARKDQIVANMSERAYEMRVSRFAATWNEKSAAPALASHVPQPGSPPQNPVNIDFPSASSIPPISIMSNEPGRPGQNGVEAAAKPEPRHQAASPPTPPPPPTPARRSQKAQAPRPAPQPTPPPAAADPFPQPVGSAPQTTGAPAPQ